MPNDYLTVAEFKAAMPDFDWGTSSAYDSEISRLITTASRAIDRDTMRGEGEYYVSVDQTRYFDGPSKGFLEWHGAYSRVMDEPTSSERLAIGELAATPTSVSVTPDGNRNNYQLWAATDYIAYPLNALVRGQPITHLVVDRLYGSQVTWYGYHAGIKIVGKFGYSVTVPADVKHVTIQQAMRWFKLEQQNYQDRGSTGNLPFDDSRFYGERWKNLDADLMRFIDHRKRIGI